MSRKSGMTDVQLDPRYKSFSDGFLEELFDGGEAARKLVELQQRSIQGKFSFGP